MMEVDENNSKLIDSDMYWDNLLIRSGKFGLVHENDDDKKDEETIRRIYGEPVNKNPLLEIPSPNMRLYFVNEIFFETVEELLKYYKSSTSPVNDFNIIDYYRNLAGYSDVIKVSNKNETILYTAKNEYGYLVYDSDISIYRGEYTWIFKYGDIRKLYKPFRDRGMVFENDVYEKIDKRNKWIDDYYKNHNIIDKLRENKKK